METLLPVLFDMWEKFSALGLWGGLSAVLFSLVTLWRSNLIQNLLPDSVRIPFTSKRIRLKWGVWSSSAKLGFVGVLSLLGSLAASKGGGLGVQEALQLAIPVAFGAMGVRKTWKILKGDPNAGIKVKIPSLPELDNERD